MVLQCNITIDGKYHDTPAKLILGQAFTGKKKKKVKSGLILKESKFLFSMGDKRELRCIIKNFIA